MEVDYGYVVSGDSAHAVVTVVMSRACGRAVFVVVFRGVVVFVLVGVVFLRLEQGPERVRVASVRRVSTVLCFLFLRPFVTPQDQNGNA